MTLNESEEVPLIREEKVRERNGRFKPPTAPQPGGRFDCGRGPRLPKCLPDDQSFVSVLNDLSLSPDGTLQIFDLIALKLLRLFAIWQERRRRRFAQLSFLREVRPWFLSYNVCPVLFRGHAF